MKDLTTLGATIINLDLIEIKDRTPVANTEQVDEYIAALTEYVDDSIKNDLDVEVIEAKIKETKTTIGNFIDYRKSFTAPLQGLTKEFTAREAKMKEQYERLDARKKEMLEEVYVVAEKAIRAALDSLQSSSGNIAPDMSVFDSFIAKQREVKGMQPGKDGKLSKASLEKIEKEFEKHVAPIREQMRLEESKKAEQKNFEMYLENINVKGDNVDQLNAAVINLEKLKTQVPELYPNIVDQCIRTLDNKIGLAKGNINTIKAIEAQKVAEEAARIAKSEASEAIKEAEEVRNADDEIIQKLNAIESGIDMIADDSAMLNEELDVLRNMWHSIRYTETRDKAKALADKIKGMIAAIAETEKGNIVEVDFRITDTLENVKKVKEFMLANSVTFKSI